MMELNVLVVHPSYWRRRHGSTLVEWGMKLASTDKVGVGVISTEGGKPLYKWLGFTYLDDLPLDEGISVEVMAYEQTESQDKEL